MATQTPGGPPAAAPLLQVDGVTLAFGGVKALTGVSFDVQPGSITAVIGPNGAGKTSLFNTISGFYRPTGGSIRFKGQDITRIPAPQRARMGLGRSFQNIALFRGMTVLDNIKLGRHAHLKHQRVRCAVLPGPRAPRRGRSCAATSRNASSTSSKSTTSATRPSRPCPTACRSAWRWRARWPCSPKILMLDEPVAGMNREETEDMARFILDVRAEWGVTVLMVEHDMGMVMDLSDHVVVLNFGQVIAQGTPAVVQADPEVNRAYLGSGDVGDLRRKLQAGATSAQGAA
jgi:branched-chain amino acid transport system ATP-binding protein